MSDVIQAAIVELSQGIAVRQEAIRGLQALGMMDGTPRTPVTDAAAPEKKTKNGRTGGLVKRPTSGTPVQAQMLEIAAASGETFTVEDIQRQMRGRTPLQIRWAIAASKKSGRVVVIKNRCGHNPAVYALASRRHSNGARGTAPASPAPSRPVIPGLDAPTTPQTRAELEAALEKALKDRDAARSRGNDTLLQIYQSKIEKLEQQLETVDA